MYRVALLTNPGYTMPHQLRSAVGAGDGPLFFNASMDYEAAAAALGSFYENNTSPERPASESAPCAGFPVAPLCPFHSRSLPTAKKLALLRNPRPRRAARGLRLTTWGIFCRADRLSSWPRSPRRTRWRVACD